MSNPRRREVLAGGLAALLPSAVLAANEKPKTPAKAKRKALFVFGGWPGHEPGKCRDIFVPWLGKAGFDVVVSETLDPYADEPLMKSLDLVVQIWTMGTIKKEQVKGLLNAVKVNGTGLAGWHGGLGDAFRNETEYEYMVGGNWVAHPGNKREYAVNITDHEDPITAGLADFKVHTEQYFMHTNPNNKVLATTTFNAEPDPWIGGSTMPVVWKRAYGKGRVFYTSLGHSADVFDTPEALTLTQRGILWAAESKYASTPDLVSPVYPAR